MTVDMKMAIKMTVNRPIALMVLTMMNGALRATLPMPPPICTESLEVAVKVRKKNRAENT